MDHGVHYHTSDGETRFEPVASLEAAVSLVERLRNEDGASDVRVYRQVPIEFKTYYKVVVGDAPAPAPEAAPAAAPGTPPPGAMPLTPAPPAPPAAAAEAAEADEAPKRNSLFARG